MAYEHGSIWPVVSWHWIAFEGGGNVDMTIMQGRFWPVGSVQVGNVCGLAAKTIVAAVDPVTNAITAKMTIATLTENHSFFMCFLYVFVILFTSNM